MLIPLLGGPLRGFFQIIVLRYCFSVDGIGTEDYEERLVMVLDIGKRHSVSVHRERPIQIAYGIRCVRLVRFSEFSFEAPHYGGARPGMLERWTR